MNEEELRAEIVRLTEENKTLSTTNDSLTTEKDTLTKRVQDLQEHNQKLFLKVTTNDKENDKKKDEDEVQSCEDFAKTLKL